jgi:hypothetical protein
MARTCPRFQAIEDVRRDSVASLRVNGPQDGFSTTAKLESGPESRTFSDPALRAGDARFTVRRDFYVITFVTQFLSEEETTAELSIDFEPTPPPNVRCSVSGKRKDKVVVTIVDLETA